MNGTNETLIAYLKETGAIRSMSVEEAFRAIDRAKFVPGESADAAYLDMPLSIGAGQTISQPTVVAHCFEWLSAEPGDRVLDVGSGSGWTTALLAHIVGPAGSVTGVERMPELVTFGAKNLSQFSFPQAHIEPARKELGKPKEAPFDRILVSAAADTIPDALMHQLKDQGRMVIPVRNAICAVNRSGNEFKKACHEGYSFVPLVT